MYVYIIRHEYIYIYIYIYRTYILSKGEQPRKLLLDHGSFEKIEGYLERYHEQQKKKTTEGGYVTRMWLMQVKHYTKQLCRTISYISRYGFYMELLSGPPTSS